MNPGTVTLREYETGDISLRADEYRVLRGRYAGKFDLSPGEEAGEYRLTSRGFVGRVALPSGRLLVIEPKVPVANLMHMLCTAADLAWLHLPDVGVAPELDGFEVLGRAFVGEVERVLQQGMHSDFRPLEDDLPLVRGRIMVGAQVRRYGEMRHRHLCSYTDRTEDTAENRVLGSALRLVPPLLSREGGEEIARRVRAILPRFAGVTYLAPGAANRMLRALRVHRLNARYSRVLGLAGLLLAHLSVGARPGGIRYPSFLVDMGRLFEAFLTARMRSLLRKYGLRVVAQQHDYLDESKHVGIRPDLLVYARGADTPSLVIDAKYKTAGQTGEDYSRDLYQVAAYATRYGTQVGALVYAAAPVARPHPRELKLLGTDRSLHLLTLDLSLPGSGKLEAECCRLAEEVRMLVT